MPTYPLMTLSPAYGRDYKTKAEVLVAYHENMDFILHSFDAPSTYINKEQVPAGTVCNIRYAAMRKICVVK